MTIDEVEDIELLRRAAKVLEAENLEMAKMIKRLKREVFELKHGKPEQLKLEMHIQELEEQLARRNKLLFGDSSEKRARLSRRRPAKGSRPATGVASSPHSKPSNKSISQTSKPRRVSFAGDT